MSKDVHVDITEEEMKASEKRAARLKQVNEELKDNKDSEMAKILAEIAAKNKQSYD